MLAKRAYQFRFYPDPQQETLLAQTFGCVRYVYNSILRYRTDAYYQANEKVSYLDANARLTAIKKLPELLFLNDVSSVPLQQCLRNQQAGFKNFFEGRAKYPVFKSKKHRQSAEFTYRAFSYRDGELKLAKCATPLNIKWSRPLPSDPTTITLSKDQAGRYFVSCLCEFDPMLLPVTDKKVGIDVGIKDLFVTSDGFKSGNPRHTTQHAAKELSRNNFPKSGGLGCSGVVPFWQEIIELDGHVLLERLGILTPGFKNFADDADGDLQASGGFGFCHVVFGSFDGFQRHTPAGTCHMGEQAVFNRVVFGAIGWIVGNAYFQVQAVRQCLQVLLEQVRRGTVAATTIT
jgi:hypothetical protein